MPLLLYLPVYLFCAVSPGARAFLLRRDKALRGVWRILHDATLVVRYTLSAQKCSAGGCSLSFLNPYAQRTIGETMTKAQHRKLHKKLHATLDKLIIDWMACGAPEAPRFPSAHTILELREWSHIQTLDPEEPKR